MIPITTWKRPRLSKNDRWEIQTTSEHEKRNLETGGIIDKYITTWTSPSGAERRQFDYIIIDAKYRNKSRTAQSNTHWHANMNKNQQRRVQKTQLRYIESEKYKTPIPEETGAKLKYDIRELRIRPGNLTKRHQRHGAKDKPPTLSYRKQRKNEMTHTGMDPIQNQTRRRATTTIAAQKETDKDRRTITGNKIRRIWNATGNIPTRPTVKEICALQKELDRQNQKLWCRGRRLQL